MKDNSEFKRVLSKKDVLALSFGAMIGWGWIVLAGNWILAAGTLGAMIAFLIGGIMIVFVGLTYAELTSAMPKCGGEHVFSERALGRNASFICTWAIILGYVSVVAFEAVAFPGVVEYLYPNYVQGYMYSIAGYDVHLTWVAVGMIASIIIALINYVGVKPAAFIQGILTVMIGLVGVSFFTGAAVTGSTVNMQPGISNGISGILMVTVMTPFMFLGFDVIPQAAEEINLPFKSIGRILILSVVMAVAWYILIIFGVGMSLNSEALASASMPTVDAMKVTFGGSEFAAKLMIIAGIGGILSSWNSFFVGGSRAIYALAESGMLPKFLAKLHPKYKTPTNAILLIGILSTLAPLLGKSALTWLVDAGGLTVVVAYFMVALSFLVLRKKEPNMPRPYEIKYGKAIGVIALILTLGMGVLYMPGAPSALIWPYEWAIILGWTILGVVFFVWAKATYTEPVKHTSKKVKTKTVQQ